MRTAHKAITIVIAAALTLSVNACGTSSTPPKPTAGTIAAATPTASTTATPTPTPTVAKGWVTATKDNPFGIDWATQTPFTGPATDKFGATNVMAAYREMINFSLQEGYSDLMAKGNVRPVEFSFVNPYLTPSAQKLWAGYVKAALAGDPNAIGSVLSLITWNSMTAQDVYKFRTGQLLYTTGVEFSPAKTSVQTTGGTDSLVIQFSVTRKIRVIKDDKPVLLPLKKDLTYILVPNGLKDIRWLINGWSTTVNWEKDKVTPDPLGVNS